MKKSMSLLAMLLFVAGVYAQEESAIKDKKEETVTTKLVVNNGKTVEKITVKEETTSEKNEVRFKDEEGSGENQSAEYVPTESKRTVRVSNNDAAYASLAKATYYIYNNKRYVFIQDKTGFKISYYDGAKQTEIAKVRKTNAKDHFLATGKGFSSGIGYFDEKKNFILEYPDQSGNMTSRKYTLIK